MNIDPIRRINSSFVGNNLTLTGTVLVTGNIDATTTNKTVTVGSLVTKDYITLPTTVSAAPTVGKLGYIFNQGGSSSSFTSGNYNTPCGTNTLSPGVYLIFGCTTFSFTTPTSLTKIGIQFGSAYIGNSVTLSGAKSNSQSAIEYATPITSNIPSKITLNTPPYYHNVTNSMVTTGTTALYLVNNATFTATPLQTVSYIQAIRIA